MTMVRLCFFVQKFLTVTTALNRFRAICCCVWPKKKTIMIAGRPSLNAPIVCLCRLSATVVPMTGVVVSWKEKPTGFPFPSRNWKTLVRSPSFVGICQLARPSKERERKRTSRSVRNAIRLCWFHSRRPAQCISSIRFPPHRKKTFSTASYICFFFPFYICCCGLIIIPRPSIKNDDNSVVTSVVDVCWCLSGCAAIDWLKGNKKKGVGSPIGFLRQTEEKIKRLFLLLLLSNRPCQSVRGRELIESV